MKKLFKKSIACLIAVLMVVSTMPFTAVTASAADEVEITGAVQYGPVIFTHGTNTVSTDYNFMMKGTQIAAGDVVSATDCKTTVTVASGVTINSVSCVEDAGAQLTVSNNLLTGSFSTNKDDTTVTLKTTVTYNGKTYVSYNKVYVDTIPVPAHAASMSQRWYGARNPSKSINAYSQTLKGSLGQNSTDGSSSSNQVKANAKELYVPGTTVRYDNNNDTNHWRLTHNITIDKVAGYTGYGTSGGWGTGTTTLTTVAPTGNYYYDKSTTNNYGFSSQNGNSFSFELITIPFNIVTGDNADSGSVNLDTHTLTGDNFTQSDPYTTWRYSSGVPSITKFTNVITGNASSITNGTMAGTYELRFATQNSKDVWAVNITKSNWNVYVADKSAARNPYKTANSSIKTADVYTADSWSAYKTAYLNAEAFLANYKNTADSSVQTNATTYGNALTSAYDGLTLAPTEYTVTFKYYDNKTVVKTIDIGNPIGEFPTNTKPTADSFMPDLGHNVYKWDTTLTKDSVPTSDITISEAQDINVTPHSSETPATCTTKQTCDACGAEFGNFGSHTLKETTAKDATCTEDGNSAYWTCSTCKKMFSDAEATMEITDIPTISASGHSLAKVDEVPSTCAVKGTAAYWTCTKCKKKFSDEQGKKEISAPVELPLADHSWGKWTSISDTQHQRVCANEKSHVETEKHNIVNGACTECDYVTIDTTAYDNAVAEYEEIIGADDYSTKYTEASRTAYQEAVRDAKRDSFATKEEVDAATSAIISAQALLAPTSFEINVYVARENVEAVKVDSLSRTYNYGDVLNLDVTDSLNAEDQIAKWVIYTKDGKVNTKIASVDRVITMVATEKADVYVHIADEKETEETKYSKVSFISKNGAVSFVQYLEKGETINTIDVPGVEIPFYKFMNWDKASVTADGSDIEVKAVYEFIENTDNRCNVHYNGTTKSYAYDSFVYLYGAEDKKLALSTDETKANIITYLNENAFYAPHTENIYVIEVDESEMKASVGITGTYTTSTNEKKTATFNCKFYVPDDCEVVEYGLIATSTKGSKKIKGETASKRGEYCIVVSMAKNSEVNTVDGVAYLTYKTGGKLETIYSTTVPQNV